MYFMITDNNQIKVSHIVDGVTKSLVMQSHLLDKIDPDDEANERFKYLNMFLETLPAKMHDDMFLAYRRVQTMFTIYSDCLNWGVYEHEVDGTMHVLFGVAPIVRAILKPFTNNRRREFINTLPGVEKLIPEGIPKQNQYPNYTIDNYKDLLAIAIAAQALLPVMFVLDRLRPTGLEYYELLKGTILDSEHSRAMKQLSDFVDATLIEPANKGSTEILLGLSRAQYIQEIKGSVITRRLAALRIDSDYSLVTSLYRYVSQKTRYNNIATSELATQAIKKASGPK